MKMIIKVALNDVVMMSENLSEEMDSFKDLNGL